MGWLSRFRRSESRGASPWRMLEDNERLWRVASPRGFPSFLRALPDLFPTRCVLYLEDGSPSRELKTHLKSTCYPDRPVIPGGTSWPKPLCFHLSLTRENMTALADLSERCAEPELAIHVHVYTGDRLLLQWYDAFADPMLISMAIPEDRVKKFAAQLQVEYGTEGTEREDSPDRQ